ncbi:HIT domain-containing protein [Aliiglaciecola sp. LCG003]|uniref:HIT domain-containing protein n=1 Tax=Aliiglaciecola sp. LCG003 TaxID=3053655 RepID=UPI0025740732|nr:HIT domain-containing protein [Aliiglaciecola sp. LCG003]WJG08231.1 HIT domain-containing protein [Aliiglaciecola sp. LCG003]
MVNNDFQLHPQLAKDCFEVCNLPLSKILLLNDSQFPWFIQVPRLLGVSEIIELNDAQQSQLWYESKILSETISHQFQPDKLNVAALGNMVPQLHIHHIARYKSDPVWPKPVWGILPAKRYTQEARDKILLEMKQTLEEKLC